MPHPEEAMKLRKHNKLEAGTAVVEGALTLLLLITFLFGIMEAGRFFNVQQTLTDAAREGARVAVAPITGSDTLNTADVVCNTIRTFTGSAGIKIQDIQINDVSIDNGSGCPTTSLAEPAAIIITVNGIVTKYARVRVRTTYQLITLAMFKSLNITLQGKALMRYETSN